MNSEKVQGLPLSQCREALENLVSTFKVEDPLYPVTVIGPSVYANLSLRHRLARTGFANVRFMALPRLSELLGAPALSQEGRRPLTPILENAAVRAVAAEASGPLEAVKNHPATVRSLRNGFRSLRHASKEALVHLEGRGPLRKELVRLFGRFREHSRGYYDREDLAESAARAVGDGRASSAVADLGFIIFYLPRELTRGERDLIKALLAKGQGGVILGLSGDDTADAPVFAVGEMLGQEGLPQSGQIPPTTEENTRLLIAPDPHQEVRWAIRNTVKGAEEGVPFHRMAVLYRTSDPYAKLIGEELELTGIPAAGPASVTLAETAAGRTLLGLLKLAEGDLNRREVTDWLTGCPIKAPQKLGGDLNPSLWDAITKKAGVVQGLEQWSHRLQGYGEDLEQVARRGVDLGEITEARAEAMQAEARSTRVLKEFVEELYDRTRAPQEGSPWREFSRWAKFLLSQYLGSGEDLPQVEEGSLERVTQQLEELEGVDALEPAGTNLARFQEAVVEALKSSVGHVGTTGQGLFVGPVGVVTGMDFELVHIVGMTEGAFPPLTAEEPLLPDEDRQAAGGASEGLSLQRSRRAEERYAFLAALESGASRVLSFPQADPSAQRTNYPSQWFLEQASQLEDARLYTSSLLGLKERPWLTCVSSMEHLLTQAAEEGAADPHEYNLSLLWTWKGEGGRLADHPLVGGQVKDALEMREKRESRELSRWDGDLSQMPEEFKEEQVKRLFSPTSLERWAKCPFSYYLGSVLGIGNIEDPEEIFEISPLEKGLLIHQILEEFMGRVKQMGELPGPTQSWREKDRQLLREVALEAFQRAKARGVTGKEVIWQAVQEEILSDLDIFLREDLKVRSQLGLTPSLVEPEFGSGKDWPEVLLELEDGEVVRFRGMIDRVDGDAAGEEVVVIDYKTGRSGQYSALNKDAVDGGKRLQLPIYALAARGALGEKTKVKAVYWFISSRGGFSLRPESPMDLEVVEKRAKHAISTVIQGIRGGIFPANPGGGSSEGFGNCRNCDFNSLCPSRRDVHWDRKSIDPRLSPYIALSAES